jgi:hypothetical protein
MGMYDDVDAPELPCWNCGSPVSGWQSKDGPRALLTVPTTDVDRFYSSCPLCGARNEFARQVVRLASSVFHLDAAASRLGRHDGGRPAGEILAERGQEPAQFAESEGAERIDGFAEFAGEDGKTYAECSTTDDGTILVSFHVNARNNSYGEHVDDLTEHTWFAFYIDPDGEVMFRNELMSTVVKGHEVDSETSFKENQRVLDTWGLSGYDYDLVATIPRDVFAGVIRYIAARLLPGDPTAEERQAEADEKRGRDCF